MPSHQSDIADTAGVRERQRRETIAAIERAALQLFADRGFDDVTVEEIASAAGVARRTFFRYFSGGKEAVLLRVLSETTTKVERTMAARPPQESALEAVRASLQVMAEHLQNQQEDFLLRAKIMEDSPSLAARAYGEQLHLIRSLTHMAALRLGVDPLTDLRPGVLVATACAAAQIALESWLQGGFRDLTEAMSVALDLVETGMGQAGRRSDSVAG